MTKQSEENLDQYLSHLPEDHKARVELKRLRGCLEYFIARCEGRHPDGYIRSKKTYQMFKEALSETQEGGG